MQKTKNVSCSYYTILFCCTKKYQTKFYTLSVIKFPNKQELQQSAFNYLLDIDFEGFTNLYNTVKL